MMITTTAEEDAELQADIDRLPDAVIGDIRQMLVSMICTSASGLAYAAKQAGCENFEDAVAAGHHFQITGDACGFDQAFLKGILFRLRPELHVKPMILKMRSLLDEQVLEDMLAVANTRLLRHGTEVSVLPRTDDFDPPPARDPNWVRAKPWRPAKLNG